MHQDIPATGDRSFAASATKLPRDLLNILNQLKKALKTFLLKEILKNTEELQICDFIIYYYFTPSTPDSS
jgi:hypothetical protein